jgi:hypothetical protein
MTFRQEHSFNRLLIGETGVVRSDGDGEGLFHGQQMNSGRVAVSICGGHSASSKQIPRPMKIFTHRLALVALLLVVAGCSTPDSRISGNQAMYNSWSPDVREKVRTGRVDVGFTSDMVRMALGAPDRQSTRTTAQGTAEVWIYFDHGPKFSFGVGMGSSHGSTAYGGGVVMGDNTWADDEVMRVIFSGDRVVAIESRH